MDVHIIDPPEYAALDLSVVKQHLRVDHDDDDDLIEALIEAATSHIDGPTGWLGRSLITRTMEIRGPGWRPQMLLPYPPVVADGIVVKYLDNDGADQAVDADIYRLVGSGYAPYLTLAHGASWPSCRNEPDSVRIRYSAGYGDSYEDIPMAIRHALLLMVGELYERRELTTDQSVNVLPFAASALLSTYRVMSI